MRMRAIMIIGLFLVPAAWAKLVAESVEYRHGKTVLEGYLAYDNALEGKRPGVLIIHDWMGLGDLVRAQADSLARMGYVAFAADIYGKGVRPADAKEAAAEASKYKGDVTLLRHRARAGLERLKSAAPADAQSLAAIGFCFGGGAVLELARSGADLDGVVSFHGNLNTPRPKDARNVKAKVLVLHGADDPHVPWKQVENFMEEMRQGGVNWQMNFYGDAVHAYTKPAAGDDPKRGSAYNEQAARRSWQAMRMFFDELFPRRPRIP